MQIRSILRFKLHIAKFCKIINASIALLAFIICGCSTWTKQDTIRHAAFTALMGIDYAQTMRIANNPDKWHEHNPIMGKHPSTSDVSMYFVGSYVATTALVAVLPPPYREWIQYSAITIEAACIGNNYTIGIGWGL